MKLVSPKNLLAALFGCLFVVVKGMTFDGLADLFWILFIGFLSVRAVIAAFSQEACDRDMRQAQQKRALYRDLFGKFAYVAADVPMLLILLACLLVVFFPLTAPVGVCLAGLILAAVGYTIWMCSYVFKNKWMRMENGSWDRAVLSAEEEEAWKRSDLWHGILYGIVVALGVLYLLLRG